MQVYCPPAEFAAILVFIEAHTVVAKQHTVLPARLRLYKWWFYANLEALVVHATLATQLWHWASYDSIQ